MCGQRADKYHPKLAGFARLLLLAFIIAFHPFTGSHAQELVFPALTDRVVDAAGLLDEASRKTLIDRLAQHELDTGNQIVVVTVTDLQGYSEADYANRLGRHWGIGEAERNNGLILLVAPNERKVRIEVGYGLEGAVPDATASDIIRRKVLPSFRENEFTAGINNGIDAILQAVDGEYVVQPAKPRDQLDGKQVLPFIAFAFIAQLLMVKGKRRIGRAAFPATFVGIFASVVSGQMIIGVFALLVAFAVFYMLGKRGEKTTDNTGPHPAHRRTNDGRRQHSSSSGGFRGGGGSFGGGGASGSW